MKKLLLLGTAFAASIGGYAQAYGERIGLTYYDLVSNSSGVNRIVYNEDDKSVSAVWIQSITPAQQPVQSPIADRGIGYNHRRFRTSSNAYEWVWDENGACPNFNGCSTPGTNNYSGWPEVINFPKETVTVSGVNYDITPEVVITHSGGLKLSKKLYRGDADVFDKPVKMNLEQGFCASGTEGTWPRAVRSGNRYIHMTALNYGDPDAPAECEGFTPVIFPFLYYRSSNQGTSWDIWNKILPGMKDTSMYSRGSGDAYQIASNGENVAIISNGTFTDDPWVLWKSTDNGLTWNYTVIRDFDPYQYDISAYDAAVLFGETDPLPNHIKNVSDGSMSITIDDDGVVHCFTGVQAIAIDTATMTADGSWYPNLSHGIWYWNDGDPNLCEPVLIADLVDYFDANGNKLSKPLYFDDAGYDALDWMSPNAPESFFLSKTSMPTASIDDNGNIYVVYSSEVEGTSTGKTGKPTDEGAIPLRDLYIVWSKDGGKSWSHEINVAGEIAGADDGSFGSGIEDDIYPAVPSRVGSDNTLHIWWNMDFKPGSQVQTEDGFSEQFVMWYGLDITDLPTDKFRSPIVGAPNTMTNISGGSIANDSILVLDLSSTGRGITFEPYVAYLDSTERRINSGALFRLDTVVCVLDSTCDAVQNPDTNNIINTLGQINGKDSVEIVDTIYYTYDVEDLNNDGDAIFYISGNNGGIYDFTANYMNACPNPIETIQVITLGGSVTANILEDTIFICKGETADLTVIANGSTGNYTYAWDNSAGSALTAAVTPTSTTTYTVTVTDGTSAQDSVVVFVRNLPTADAGTDGTVDLSDDCKAPLGTGNVSNNVVQVGANATTGLTYSWAPPVGMEPADLEVSDPVITDIGETTTYTLTVTDENGCTATDEVTVTVTPNPYPSCTGVGVSEELQFTYSVYPTPTSDVLNISVSDAKLNAVTIYNNLGSIVNKVELKGVTNTSLNTTGYAAGTYYVFIQTDNGETTKQITVVR